MTEEVLKVKNLKGVYKGNFGTVYAVDGVSFEINKGDIVAIAGESGSGKSTLAELMTGAPMPMLHYQEGQVTVGGHDLYIPKPPKDSGNMRKWRKDQKKLANLTRREVLCKIIGLSLIHI